MFSYETWLRVKETEYERWDNSDDTCFSHLKRYLLFVVVLSPHRFPDHILQSREDSKSESDSRTRKVVESSHDSCLPPLPPAYKDSSIHNPLYYSLEQVPSLLSIPIKWKMGFYSKILKLSALIDGTQTFFTCKTDFPLMKDPLEILSRCLSMEEGEDPLVEWKARFPRKQHERKGKEGLAKAIVALANSAVYHGAEAAYLFIGIHKGRIVGIKPDPEDQKILADILKERTMPLMTTYTLKHHSVKEVERAHPGQPVQGGIYCITIEPPSEVPYRYRKERKEPGAILIRHGSEVAEADSIELRDLFRRIEHGPAEIIIPEDKEIMSKAAEEAGRIAHQLKLGDRKAASKLAYKLLLDPGNTHLFNRFQFSTVLVIPLIRRLVNPFSLLMTASGHKARFKMKVYPRSVRDYTEVLSVDTEIQAWEDMRAAYSEVLKKGLPRETTKDLQELDFHELARGLRQRAKRILAEASQKDRGPWNFWWVERSYPIGTPVLPPKDWIPQEPPFRVDGIAVFNLNRFRMIGPSGIQVRLPILTSGYEEQNIVWWAIFLDGHIFLQFTMWPDALPLGGRYHPWEREPWDLMEDGKLSWEEYVHRISKHEVRLNRWPVWIVLGTMSLFSLLSIVTDGSWWPLVFTTGLWAFYLGWIIVLSKERKPSSHENGD